MIKQERQIPLESLDKKQRLAVIRLQASFYQIASGNLWGEDMFRAAGVSALRMLQYEQIKNKLYLTSPPSWLNKDSSLGEQKEALNEFNRRKESGIEDMKIGAARDDLDRAMKGDFSGIKDTLSDKSVVFLRLRGLGFGQNPAVWEHLTDGIEKFCQDLPDYGPGLGSLLIHGRDNEIIEDLKSLKA
jgi:hypothetical protein